MTMRSSFPGKICALAIVTLVTISSLVSTVIAEPIGLVTVGNPLEAQTVREIVGTAYARSGNRFLVSADSVQQASLVAAGLAFESVIDDTDPGDVYQILSLDRPRQFEKIDLERLGTVFDLGHGLRIMPLTRAEAVTVSMDPQLEAVPLSQRSVAIFFPQSAVAAPLGDDFPSDSLAARINQDSLRSYVQRLEDFRTRYCYTDSCIAARDWIVAKFRSWGYTDVTTPSFYYGGMTLYNVKAVKPGSAESDKLIVVGGHYDSWTNSNQSPGPYEYAPGADDDATGVALTLELARTLANVPLRKTIVFMPFDAEEVGLVGSSDAASDFAIAGSKVEVMFNYDMVAYTFNSVWDLNYSSGDVSAFRDFATATATRVSSIIPVVTAMGSSSDHYSFDQQGFPVVDHIESDFNTPGWHTNLDLTSRLNFPYFKEVAKASIATVAVVANAAYPSTVNEVVDVGDGQSLEISWTDCNQDYSYTVFWGTQTGVYTDSATVPEGDCSFTVTGLQDGAKYYILVVGEAPNGYRAFYGIEGTGTSFLYPRSPTGLAGTPSASQLRLILTWQPNAERDFSHYRVYRRIGSVGNWQNYADGITATTFTDSDVKPHVGYEYAITAIDLTGYESVMSSSVLIYPATFDGGPVVADGFVMDHEYDPDQAEQHAWLDSICGAVDFAVAPSDENGGPLTLGSIGQYGTLIWIDDDLIFKNISQSNAALDEFSKHGTNMMISGFETWFSWAAKSVPTSHLLYREFGLASYNYTSYFDFIGAVGQNGWPSVAIDTKRGMDEWPYIPKLTPRAGGQVILRFDSEMDLPEWEGQPVGMVYQTANGKRVLLSFPLYYLTPASATALMAKIFEYFALTSDFDKGDLDHSGTVDIGDVSVLIDHLFISLDPLAYPDEADVDSRAGVSIGDVMYLINYLFMGGPSPIPAGANGIDGLQQSDLPGQSSTK
jgi:hypothetical protein